MFRTLAVVAVLAASPSLALTGREVIDAAQRRHGYSTWRDRTSSAAMDSYEGDTLVRSRELDISEQSDARGGQRSLSEFTGPADVRGTLFLHLSPRGSRDEQWMWTPATRRARRMSEAKLDENFLGSDFTYRDLELLVRIQQWNEEEATATLTGEENLDGKSCHIVDLVPRNEELPYSRYRLWFATADSQLWRVDVYGPDDRLLKRVQARRQQRVQNYTTLMETVVSNVPEGTHTVFTMREVRYDHGVSDDHFTVANLARGR